MTKINVMIVDDDELDRYLVTRTLSNFDVFGHVAEVPDGSDAAELFKAPDFMETWGPPPPPTLVLLDINMPRMTGFELLDYLDNLNGSMESNWTSCVILMLTSSSNQKDRAQADEHDQVMGYFEKPITAEKVQEILDAYYDV